MPTSHSPRRSPRLLQSSTTTATTITPTGFPASFTSAACAQKRPQTSKENGTLGRNPNGTLQPERSGQNTSSATVKVSTLLERIATLEKELTKARANGGQVEAGRNPVENGLSGNRVSGATNTPLCMSETVCLSETLPVTRAATLSLSANMQRQFEVTPFIWTVARRFEYTKWMDTTQTA